MAPYGSVTALGPHILDVLGRPVESIPPGQGAAMLTEIRATAAGTAAGAAVDLAKLGARVYSAGAIGDDLIGDVVVAALRRHGVDTTGLVRKPGVQTSATMLPIRPNGERPALHVPGASRRLQVADIDAAAIARCDALLFGGPDALSGLAAAELREVGAAASAAGVLVVVDVLYGGSRRAFERLGGLLGCADWFWPNEEQLLALTGRDELPAAIDDVLRLGTGGVAVTLGARGCLLATQQVPEPVPIPAISVDVVDTTGCGDAFNAGMLTGLLLGSDPADSAWLGVACGALVATGLGSDAGIASLGQAVEFLAAAAPETAARIGARIAALAVGQARTEPRQERRGDG